MIRRQLGRTLDTVRLRGVAMTLLFRAPLPPGDPAVSLDSMERADRRALLRKAASDGPIFKGRAWDEFWIYVVGLNRSRNILKEYGERLDPVTIDVGSLFPEGLLRQMQGNAHRKYREALVQAIRSSSTPAASVGSFCDQHLERLAEAHGAGRLDAGVFLTLVSAIVLEELTASVLGILPDDPLFAPLSHQFQELGGNGLVWNVGARQQRSCRQIEALLVDAPADDGSILAHLRRAGELDRTMLGNLIYMVEMGRYDLAVFFRWLTWFAGFHPEAMEWVAAEDEPRKQRAAAFVYETLRLEQSERLVRRVNRDFVADGLLFPKGAKVRFCLWESHKLPESFDDAFSFDPGRFVGDRPGRDRFSPFGLDAHQCPFGSYSIALAAAWVAALARHFRVLPPDAGDPVRGLYHWEPPKAFAPVLELRQRPGGTTERPHVVE